MQIYSYWSRATLNCQDQAGNSYHLVAYAGSDQSPAAARAASQELVQARHARLRANELLGGYPTGTAPLREQLEQRLYDGQGRLLGAITRNRYGSLVLNAARVMLLDVDDADLRQPLEPTPEPFSLARLFRRLLTPAPPRLLLEPAEQMQLRLAAWLQLHPEWKFRLYRTRLGFRLIVMHQLLAPGSAEAQAVFAALRTDPIYVHLCQTQDCYRARLSPKPWRIGLKRPTYPFPFDTPEQEQHQQDWERQYTARSQDFSVCEWVGEYGTGYSCPEARQLAELHDAACLGGRPLA